MHYGFFDFTLMSCLSKMLFDLINIALKGTDVAGLVCYYLIINKGRILGGIKTGEVM